MMIKRIRANSPLVWLMGLVIVLAGLILCTHEAEAQDFSGQSRYHTAVLEAQAAYPDGADAVILVTGERWADALSATSLAGGIDAPILYTETAALTSVTADAIRSFGTSRIIVVGDELSVSDYAFHQAAALPGIASIIRLDGETRIETQMEIFRYGESLGIWSSERVIVTKSSDFADSLTAAPLAFKSAAPIFLVDEYLSIDQEEALLALAPKQVIVMGDGTSINDRTAGFLQGIALYGSGTTDSYLRFAGENRFETNLLFNEWTNKNYLLGWGRVAVTSSDSPYDAIAGAALQGKRSSYILLVSDKSDPTVQAIIGKKGSVADVSWFGGEPSISTFLRNYIKSYLGIYIPRANVWTSCLFQYPELPTGCEALALTNALTAYGYNPGKFDIVDWYMPYSSWDFVTCYCGNPRHNGGNWNSACAPAVVTAANNYLWDHGSALRAYEITGSSFSELYTYIERGYPVIVWNTIGMQTPGGAWASQWHNGRKYTLYSGTHTMVLTGFDKENGTVSVADSISGYVTRDAGTFSWIYNSMGAQAVVIL